MQHFVTRKLYFQTVLNIGGGLPPPINWTISGSDKKLLVESKTFGLPDATEGDLCTDG